MTSSFDLPQHVCSRLAFVRARSAETPFVLHQSMNKKTRLTSFFLAGNKETRHQVATLTASSWEVTQAAAGGPGFPHSISAVLPVIHPIINRLELPRLPRTNLLEPQHRTTAGHRPSKMKDREIANEHQLLCRADMQIQTRNVNSSAQPHVCKKRNHRRSK